MPDLSFAELLRRFNLGPLPTWDQIVASMDPLAWTFVLLLVGAVVLGVYVVYNTRHTFTVMDEVELTPEQWLERLQRDPTRLSPQAIINRLGAELTVELLIYGDDQGGSRWRAKWDPVREELLRLLARQEAFGTTYALARYYEGRDLEEPDTVRIRRAALIHLLGRRRHLEPGPDGAPARLYIRRHPAEPVGDLGFDGPTVWLELDDEMPRIEGAGIEMDVIDFETVERAALHVTLHRGEAEGAGITLSLHRRFKMWVVVEQVEDWT